MGRSKETQIRIINNTRQEIVNTHVYGVDNYDWDGNSRPDHNLQGLRISQGGGTVQRRLEVNYHARNCPFNITFSYSDGTVDEFRINQKHAIGWCDLNFQSIRKSHDTWFWRDGDKTLVVQFHNTEQQVQTQLQNDRAEERNKEGNAAINQKRYEAAMKKFDEAASLTNQSSTRSNIQHNKSRACNEFGKECLQKAWDAEADDTQDKSQEAQSKFDQARSLFQQARNLYNSTEYQKNFNLVNLKIEGNRLFNAANELEKEAFKLFDKEKSDNSAAQNKYREALVKYEQAVKKFEEGSKIDGKFGDSLKIARELVQDVNKAIDNINQAELNTNIGQVKIDDEKQEKRENDEAVNTNLHEEVDVTN